MATKRKKATWNPAHHPRDSKGRFTRSATRVMTAADRKRAQSGMKGFAPQQLGTAQARTEWLQHAATATPSAGSARIGAYLDGGWRDDNPALRAGKPVDGLDQLDAAFTPTPDGVMLRRTMPMQLFAHVPVDQLAGMKIRDAAPASAGLDHPGPGRPDTVTMHIAAPAGTEAFINPDAGEVLLRRDTEIAVTRAEPREDGGWDLYGVVIPRTNTRTNDGQDSADGPAADSAAPGTAADTGAANRGSGAENAGGSASGDEPPAAPPAKTEDGNAPKSGRPEDRAADTVSTPDHVDASADASAPGTSTAPDAGNSPATPADTAAPGTPAAAPASPAKPPAADTSTPAAAAQLDAFGGETNFVPAPRSAIGLSDRTDVGRERAIAATQQLGLFASDEKEMAGQGALLDALMAMPEPAAMPPAVVTAPATAHEPARLALPDDLTGWSDEQISAAFMEISTRDRMTDADEQDLQRVATEWDLRDQQMRARAAGIPDDLTTASDDQLASWVVELTATHGPIDEATVARLDAELDRRDAQRVAAITEQEATAKRDLISQQPASLNDDQLGDALSAAADLGAWDTFDRLTAESDRRDNQRAAVEAAAAAETERVAAEQRQEAARQAEAAAYAEAERRAAAEQQRVEQAMAAARAAAVIPPFTDADVRSAHQVLGDQVANVIGSDRYQQIADNARSPLPGDDSKQYAIRSALLGLPEIDRARIVMAAGDADTGARWRGMSDSDLNMHVLLGVAPNVGDTADQVAARRADLAAAGREISRRKMVKLRDDDAAAFARFREKLRSADVDSLTDDELTAAAAVLTADPDPGMLGVLEKVQQAASRRHVEAAERAARKAAGPAGPARVANPVAAIGDIERMSDSYRDREASRRLLAARAITAGLPENADERAIRAAEKTDERSLYEQAAWQLAWYRHLGEFENLGPHPRDWQVGDADDPNLPADLPTPLPGAKVAKPADVWKQLTQQAITDRDAGDNAGAIRYTQALARAYGIPVDPNDTSIDTMRRLGRANQDATRSDPRTAAQSAAAWIAEWRRLAAEQGVDPNDTLRYGPPDRRPAAAKKTPETIRPTADEEIRIDRLIAHGVPELDAYAQVLGLDADELRRRDALAATLGTMKPTAAAVRAYYADWAERQWADAENATAGVLLNKAGQAKNIDPRTLFTGPPGPALRYASEELLRWWGDHPRLTFPAFKAQLVGDARLSADLTAQAGKGNEFT